MLDDRLTIEKNRTILKGIVKTQKSILCTNPLWTSVIISALHLKHVILICQEQILFPKNFLHGLTILESITLNIPNISTIYYGFLSFCPRLKHVNMNNTQSLSSVHPNFLHNSPVHVFQSSNNLLKYYKKKVPVRIEGVKEVQDFVNLLFV
jgi:hypothetical protein